MTDLAVAASNDFTFGETVAEIAATLTVPKIKDIVLNGGKVLDCWSFTLEETREMVFANDNLSHRPIAA